MEKINVAELLKDCPKGMELDCTMFENVTFLRVDMSRKQFPIEIAVNGLRSKYLTKEGCFHDTTLLPEAKCVIFPKGKTTWEGFQRPYINGDIVYTIGGSIAILGDRLGEHSESFNSCCGLFIDGFDTDVLVSPMRLATEEEKKKLFDTIKDKGYRWNFKANKLEKLIIPNFKKGDKVRVKNGVSEPRIIEDVCDTFYTLVPIGKIEFTDQDNWELVPNKFDITTLKQFDKVLVRDCNTDKWNIDFFAYYREDRGDYQCMTFTKNQCIPYEGNQHLLGTTDGCDKFFKTWT